VKYGLIGRQVYEIKNEWITDVIIKQSFLERFLNHSNLIINAPE